LATVGIEKKYFESLKASKYCQDIESWVKSTSANSNKIFKKKNSNIRTNKLLVLNISVTSYYSNFTTVLRVIHKIILQTNSKYNQNNTVTIMVQYGS
jgi:hypothetical protein